MDFILEKFKTIREILFQGTFIRITAQYCKMKVRSEYIFIETLYIYIFSSYETSKMDKNYF